MGDNNNGVNARMIVIMMKTNSKKSNNVKSNGNIRIVYERNSVWETKWYSRSNVMLIIVVNNKMKGEKENK